MRVWYAFFGPTVLPHEGDAGSVGMHLRIRRQIEARDVVGGDQPTTRRAGAGTRGHAETPGQRGTPAAQRRSREPDRDRTARPWRTMHAMSARLDDPELLARLIAFDTTSANSNLACVDFIAAYLDVPGVRLSRFPSPDGTKVNLLAETGPEVGPDRDGLLLSGHLDVVPATEPDWTSDPFTLTRAGDRFVARGACDMKGFDALAINAVRDVAAVGPGRSLALLLSYDEEVGSLGIADLAAQWPAERRLPRATLIGEPTSLRVVRRHKGHLKVRVTTHGRSAHSGSPHLGDNAIERMTPILADLDALRQAWRDEAWPSRASFPEVPYVALIPARLRAGTALNVIPDTCTLDLGIRLLPGTDAETFLQRVARRHRRPRDGRVARTESTARHRTRRAARADAHGRHGTDGDDRRRLLLRRRLARHALRLCAGGVGTGRHHRRAPPR